MSLNNYIFLLLLLHIFSYDKLYSKEIISSKDNNTISKINIFIDCSSGCDWDYIRYEIPYLNYVREIREAQVYLLVTEENNANGGKRYTLFFIGYHEFAGMIDTLTLDSSIDHTNDLTRSRLTKTIALGMMRYVAKTPIRNNIELSYETNGLDIPEQQSDKWNSWVFEIDSEIEIEREQSKGQLEFNNSIQAYKITPEWKVEHQIGREYNFDTYIHESVDDETGEVTEIRTDVEKDRWDYRSLNVKSINDHWSIGIRTLIGADNTRNLDLEVQLLPAIEYNIFPYHESSKKQMRFLYSLGFVYNDYDQITIYERLEDRLLEQNFDIAMQVRQKWGSMNFSMNASSFVPDFSKYMFRVEGDVRVRIFRGFELRARARASLIHNQIGLPKGDMTPEELFLNLRELKTTYKWDVRTGIIYTFGSLYNNVVNPRFGN